MVFVDRIDAGQRLAEELKARKLDNPVVLALPRGGVPVGLEIARALDAPLDLVLVRKIGAPFQPELAVAAVVDGGEPITVVNEEAITLIGLPEDYIEERRKEKLKEIEQRRQLYLAGRPRARIAGATAIVVDDGIATGATTRAVLQAVRRRKPRRLVLAVPVAPPDTLEVLKAEVDELICLETPLEFGAIGYFYFDFQQVTDEEVVKLLGQAKAPQEVTEAAQARPPEAAARD